MGQGENSLLVPAVKTHACVVLHWRTFQQTNRRLERSTRSMARIRDSVGGTGGGRVNNLCGRRCRMDGIVVVYKVVRVSKTGRWGEDQNKCIENSLVSRNEFFNLWMWRATSQHRAFSTGSLTTAGC
ncbi:unnamed protein product [Ectocarpus sp. 8 AP-2014]